MSNAEDEVRQKINELSNELSQWFKAVIQFYRWQRSTRKRICCELAQSGLVRVQLAEKEVDLNKRLALLKNAVLYQQLEISYSSLPFEKSIYMWMFKRRHKTQKN